MGKAFEKQIKTTEDQGEKQINASQNSKPKEETKPIEDKSIEQKETINNLVKFYESREEVINFLETILKCYLMLITIQSKMKLREKD